MRALKLDIKLNIHDSLPILTNNSLSNISDQIVSRIEDIEIGGSDSFLVESGNGYVVDVNAEECGLSYKKIKVTWLNVCFKEDENSDYTSNVYTEQYTEELNSLVTDQLYIINDAFEAEYEESRMYQEEYY